MIFYVLIEVRIGLKYSILYVYCLYSETKNNVYLYVCMCVCVCLMCARASVCVQCL